MKTFVKNKKVYGALLTGLLLAIITTSGNAFAMNSQQHNADWQAFANSITSAQNGAVLEYSATGSENFVPHFVFQQLSGRNVSITIKRNGEIWAFNGNNLNGFNVNENQYYQTLAALGYLSGTYYVPNLGVSPQVSQITPITPTAPNAVSAVDENSKNNENSENSISYGEYK